MNTRIREKQDQYVVQALQKQGIGVNSVYDLVNAKLSYPQAIPTLLTCLREVTDPRIKEGIVRALTIKQARGIAEHVLIAEFEAIGPDDQDKQGLKWAIGNAISLVATQKFSQQVANLILNKRHGTGRQMLIKALCRLECPQKEEILIAALQDDDLAGHAANALGKLKTQKARDKLEHLLGHPNKWIRKEARQALARLN